MQVRYNTGKKIGQTLSSHKDPSQLTMWKILHRTNWTKHSGQSTRTSAGRRANPSGEISSRTINYNEVKIESKTPTILRPRHKGIAGDNKETQLPNNESRRWWRSNRYLETSIRTNSPGRKRFHQSQRPNRHQAGIYWGVEVEEINISLTRNFWGSWQHDQRNVKCKSIKPGNQPLHVKKCLKVSNRS